MNDHWRHTWARNYELRIERLNFIRLRCLQDGHVTFGKGITAIVGGNGVGKSTIANAIVDVLSGEARAINLERASRRLANSDLSAVVDKGGAQSTFSVGMDEFGGRIRSEPSFDGSFAWLDPSLEATLGQQKILNDPNFSDLLEQTGFHDFSTEERQLGNYLVGKDYAQLQVSEIEDYGDLEYLPYFRATCGATTYGSEGMGQGELSLLFTLWTILHVPNNSILILEEPETHVSSRSQSALMDVLAWACDNKGLSIIVTTHSPVVIDFLPKENIRLIVSDGNASSIIENPHLFQVQSIIGGGVAFKNLLIVEDQCAVWFAETIVELIDPDLRRQIVVCKADSSSAIDAVLKAIPNVSGWTNVIGVYDGDLRTTIKSDQFKWPHIFLPENTPPDNLLRRYVSSADYRDALALQITRPANAIVVALNAVAGLDHHDWPRVMSTALGIESEALLTCLSRIWVRDQGEAAVAFVAELKRAIG